MRVLFTPSGWTPVARASGFSLMRTPRSLRSRSSNPRFPNSRLMTVLRMPDWIWFPFRRVVSGEPSSMTSMTPVTTSSVRVAGRRYCRRSVLM